MKKTIIIAAVVATSAILLSVSCAKEEQPGFSIEERTFTATIEQGLTKTTLGDGLKVNWETGDQININGTVYSATPFDIKTSANFTKVSGNEPSPAFRAIFPATLFKSPGKYELPAIQEYSAEHFNAPMYAESLSESLFFQNICGVLCLSLTGTDIVKRISVTANEPVCGPFKINDGTVNITGTDKTVTLDCGANGVQLTQTPTKFYIYLPPQTYSAGMKIVVTNTEEYVFKKVTTKNAEILASNLYAFSWDINAFNPALTGEFSVGAGKKICFAQGNFHATKIGEHWRLGFYDGQPVFGSMSCMGSSRTVNEDDKDIDLFTWGYGSSFSTSPTTRNYVGQVSGHLSGAADWGSQIGSGSTWRTLTSAEWNYLLYSRDNAANLYRIGVTVCEATNCLIIAPDDFTGTIEPYYSNEDWTSAENNGLVCLPSAGQRCGAGLSGPGKSGFYWTSAANGVSGADVLSLNKEGQGIADVVLEEVCNNIDYKQMEGWGMNGYEISQANVDNVDCYKISHGYYAEDWGSQIQYHGNTFYNGERYTLSVKAKVSSGTYAMQPWLQESGEYGGGICSMSKLNLTTEWQEFKVSFTNYVDNGSILTFNIGDYDGDVYIAYVKLERMVNNSHIEDRILQGFPNGTGFSWGPEGTFSNSQETVDGKYCHIINNTAAGDPWTAKYQIDFPAGTFEAGQSYIARITVKSDPGYLEIPWQLLRQDGDSYPSCGILYGYNYLTTQWQDLVYNGTCTDSGATSISFQFGNYVGKIWISRASVYKLVDIPYASSSPDGVGIAANNRNYGLSVRLVRDVTPAANLNSLDDSNDYGSLFD